jgi:hypothetical protein
MGMKRKYLTDDEREPIGREPLAAWEPPLFGPRASEPKLVRFGKFFAPIYSEPDAFDMGAEQKTPGPLSGSPGPDDGSGAHPMSHPRDREG